MNISVVIPTAGLGTRIMKTPKGLIKIDEDKNILGRQIDLISRVYPQSQIIVVVGHQKEKIKAVFSTVHNIKFVESRDFSKTNVAHSIALGLKKSHTDISLIIYGDLVFDECTLTHIPLDSGNCITYDSNKMLRKDEVGITETNNSLCNMNYSLPSKWSQMMILDTIGKQKFIDKVAENSNYRMFGFEIINKLIDDGVKFSGFASSGNILEIDSPRDLANLSRFVK